MAPSVPLLLLWVGLAAGLSGDETAAGLAGCLADCAGTSSRQLAGDFSASDRDGGDYDQAPIEVVSVLLTFLRLSPPFKTVFERELD